jgi:hypothetical protein
MTARRLLVRLGVPALLIAACAVAIVLSWNAEVSEIPTFAFRSRVVLGVELTLVFFYSALLLLVPVFRASSTGDLPIELSLKGARWTEELPNLWRDFLTRSADANSALMRIDAEHREEIRILRQELREDTLALEELTDQAMERVVAIEEKVRLREGRSYDR